MMLFLVRVYQFALSPLLGSNCRFQMPDVFPAYAKESIEVHGPWRGARWPFAALAGATGANRLHDPVLPAAETENTKT